MPSRGSAGGFSLVELMLAIGLLSIILAISIDSISGNLDEGRFEETIAQMRLIRTALLGDEAETVGTKRARFGYVGDIGAIPTAGQGLAALTTKPAAVSAWALDSATRIGAGWNGPYLSPAGAGVDYTQDAWGTPYIYSPGASPPTLVSLGADRAPGGTGLNRDITLELSASLTVAKVLGVITEGGVGWSGTAEVEINYPDGSGGRTQALTSVAPADQGAFTFNGIPLGVRSATIYIPAKATAVQTFGPYAITVDRVFSLAVLDK